jgi:peroxidase
VGELFYTILVNQFERLRDGDRFFYRNVFPYFEIQILEQTTLADIIRRNTTINREIQNTVFLLQKKYQHPLNTKSQFKKPERLPEVR